jgi:hypothetical protein
MRRTIELFFIGLLSAWLIGCATAGRVYDDSKVAGIKKDTTTEAELLEWFGPASSRTLDRDGSKTLTWRFPPAKVGGPGSSGALSVKLGPDGKVVSYTASGTTK